MWPGTSIVHLDLTAGEHLDEPVKQAIALGAIPADPQPDPRWKVLPDPAGHPFCITTLAPPPEFSRDLSTASLMGTRSVPVTDPPTGRRVIGSTLSRPIRHLHAGGPGQGVARAERPDPALSNVSIQARRSR